MFVVFLRDIEERNRAEAVVRETHERVQAILDYTPALIYLKDLEGRIILCNCGFESFLGLSRQEILGKTSQDLLPRELADLHSSSDMEVMAKQTAIYTEEATDSPSGRRTFLSVKFPVFDTLGRMNGVCDISTDIGDRKQAENWLRKSEERFRGLFDNMVNGYALHEMIFDRNNNPVDCRFLSINPAFEQMTSLKKEDLIGKTVLEVLPDTEPYWIETYGNVVTTGRPERFQNYAKELERYFEVVAFTPGNNQFATIITDVTESNQAEKTLRESEERLRLCTELGNVAVWEYDFVSNSMSRSRNHDQLYGLEWQTSWAFETFLNATHPEDRDFSSRIIQNSVAVGGPTTINLIFAWFIPINPFIGCPLGVKWWNVILREEASWFEAVF